MKNTIPFLAVLIAQPAFGFVCEFKTECYESEACTDTTFSIDVDIPLQTVTSDFGDLEVIAIKKDATALVMFATGEGAEYMLTTTKGGARFAAHTTDGPQSISYLGSCEDF